MAFLREDNKRTATVKVGKTQVELIKMDKEAFESILPKIEDLLKKNYPDLNKNLLNKLQGFAGDFVTGEQ